jgi:hypothetical protein
MKRASEGSPAEGSKRALSRDEAAVYDRQLRVWGVEAQTRCATPQRARPFAAAPVMGPLTSARAQTSSPTACSPE